MWCFKMPNLNMAELNHNIAFFFPIIFNLKSCLCFTVNTNEPPHDKTNKMTVRPVKTQISLGIRPVWSESSLSAWRNLGSLATHWSHGEDPDQTLLVVSWGGSNYKHKTSVITCLLTAGGRSCSLVELLRLPGIGNQSHQICHVTAIYL